MYFPLNPNSKYGDDGIYWGSWGVPNDINFGEVYPGIFGLQYNKDESKVFADSPEGWFCYANVKDSVAFVKTFQLYEGADYPDNGAHVEVYTTGNGANLEAEVVGPIVSLDPSGGSMTFTEVWGAAKVKGPILGVNQVGMIARHLSIDPQTGHLIGNYGVFYVGTAVLLVVPQGGGDPTELGRQAVTPLQNFALDLDVEIPQGFERIEIQIFDSQEILRGVLDSTTPDDLTSTSERPVSLPRSATLLPNYPNPFNPATTLSFALPRDENVRLVIYNVMGREAVVLADGKFEAGFHAVAWNAAGHAGGVYVARLNTTDGIQTQKLVLMP